MGEVVRFPDEYGYQRLGKHVDATTEPAVIIMLPVVPRPRPDEDPPVSKRGNPRNLKR